MLLDFFFEQPIIPPSLGPFARRVRVQSARMYLPGGNIMHRKVVFARLGVLCVLALSGRFVSAQEKAAPSTAQVHVVITDMALRSDSEVPRLKPEEVKVKQGKTFLQVTQLIPAQGITPRFN